MPSAISTCLENVSAGQPSSSRDLRGHRAGVAVGRLGRGEHEVDVAGALDALGEHLGGTERVGTGERRVGDEDGLGRTHRERGAQARHLVVGRHRDQRDLAPARGVDELQRHLDAVAVGLVEDELAAAVERVVGRQRTRHGRVGNLLDADGDVHATPVHGRESARGAGSGTRDSVNPPGTASKRATSGRPRASVDGTVPTNTGPRTRPANGRRFGRGDRIRGRAGFLPDPAGARECARRPRSERPRGRGLRLPRRERGGQDDGDPGRGRSVARGPGPGQRPRRVDPPPPPRGHRPRRRPRRAAFVLPELHRPPEPRAPGPNARYRAQADRRHVGARRARRRGPTAASRPTHSG